jgi:hypothetical protein
MGVHFWNHLDASLQPGDDCQVGQTINYKESAPTADACFFGIAHLERHLLFAFCCKEGRSVIGPEWTNNSHHQLTMEDN